MGIKDYSTTASENDTAGSVNWAENQKASTVNNSARQMCADIRSWYEDMEWRDWGHTVTRTGNNTFTIAADVTSIYVANRPIRCTDSSTLYGIVASSSYSAPNTTVTVTLDSGNLSASLSAVSLGVIPTNQPIHYASIRGAASATETLTNKTINLSSNTLTGTTAQFNTALSDGDFATLAGTETLTNKTYSGGTISGTVTNSGTISGGTVSGATWSGGTFSGTVTNSGTISGGTVSGATWSGGTFSGTIAGTPTFSGSATFSGTPSFQNGASGSNTDIVQLGRPTDFGAGKSALFLAHTSTVNEYRLSMHDGSSSYGELKIGNGFQIGVPTGGDKGLQTLNVASTIYQNNVPVVTESGTQTLTNKTLTSPTIDGSPVILGATAVESTFTPTVTGGTTTPQYAVNQGFHTRIGNLVFVTVVLSSDGGNEGAGTGALSVALPIATANLSSGQRIDGIGYALNGTNEYQLAGFIAASGSTIQLLYWSAITTLEDFKAELQNNTTRYIYLSFCYRI